MSRLQVAVDAFAAAELARTGEKPSASTLSDGSFSRQTGEAFCLCYRPMAAFINFAGLHCALCDKPMTDESNAWFDEARRERARAKLED